MSSIIKVIEGQSIFDIAVEVTGYIENAYPIYLHNKNIGNMIDFDDEISNKNLSIPSELIIQTTLVNFYKKNNIKIINK